jgi:hypothetical protein
MASAVTSVAIRKKELFSSETALSRLATSAGTAGCYPTQVRLMRWPTSNMGSWLNSRQGRKPYRQRNIVLAAA